ncbi:tetratricopeptide repeat protein [bacterium]|nr:tetratricopeptide repeat protein [bacterium]
MVKDNTSSPKLEEVKDSAQEEQNLNQATKTSTKTPKMGLFKKILNPSMIFNKSSNNSLVNEGYLYLKKQKYEEAIDLFNSAIHEDDHCFDAYVGIGRASSTQGGIENAKKSIIYFNKALKIDPTKLEIYQEIINVYERLGDKRNAMAERKKQFLAKTLKSNPSDAKANNNMGILQLQQKNVNAAIVSFKKAIKCDRNYLMARSNLASAFLYKAQKLETDEERSLVLKQGLGLIDQVLEKENTAEANLIKAKILLMKGDSAKASEFCNKAISIDPSFKEAYNTKRAIEEQLGNVGEANMAYENYQSMTQQEQKSKKEKFISPFE